jgi:hypothetical protein
MGVNQAHYVLAGVKLKDRITDGTYEKYEDHIVRFWKPEKALGFGVLFDGMSGKYILAGHILAATGDDKDHFGDEPLEIELTPKLKKQIKKDLKEKIGCETDEIKIFIVTHHS